jgi:hypothetical protein
MVEGLSRSLSCGGLRWAKGAGVLNNLEAEGLAHLRESLHSLQQVLLAEKCPRLV